MHLHARLLKTVERASQATGLATHDEFRVISRRMIDEAIFSQAPHNLKLDWGWHGCTRAAARAEIIVLVDVLRFSTACAAAAAREISIIPAAMDEDLERLAREQKAILPPMGFSRLSPAAYVNLAPGTRLVVKSPNGATCARLSHGAPHVLIG